MNDLKEPTRHRGPLPLCLLLLGVVAVVVISPVALPSGSAEQQVRAPAVPRDEKLWRQALEIHRKAIVIDTHNDVTTPMANDDYDLSGTPPTPYRTSIDRLKQGGVSGLFLSVYIKPWYLEHREWCDRITRGVYRRERLGLAGAAS